MTLYLYNWVVNTIDGQPGKPCFDVVKCLVFLVYLQVIYLGDRAKEVHLELFATGMAYEKFRLHFVFELEIVVTRLSSIPNFHIPIEKQHKL